jgi:hypothetical protein
MAASATRMPCCPEASDEASLDPECCAVGQPDRGSESQPLTLPQVRTVSGTDLLPSASPAGADMAAPPPAIADIPAAAPRVPQDRLYLRNSVIRR